MADKESQDAEAGVPFIPKDEHDAGAGPNGHHSASAPSSAPLPHPISTPQQKPKLTAAIIIPIWIALSSSVIIYNNYIYNTLYFRYPVFLVTWHLGFAVSP